MKKGKSSYEFQLNCDVNEAKELVESYMKANGFNSEEKNGETYYKAGDAMVGYRYFNYTLTGNNLTIYAWLKGAFGGEISVDQSGISSINIQIVGYRDSLNSLFKEIEKLNTDGGSTVDNNEQKAAQPAKEDSQNNVTNNEQTNNQVGQKFQDETVKKQETLAEIAFWISIVGLFASFMGVAFGILIYIVVFYFASQGLKTRKKGKSIAAIVLSIISIAIVILQIVVSV